MRSLHCMRIKGRNAPASRLGRFTGRIHAIPEPGEFLPPYVAQTGARRGLAMSQGKREGQRRVSAHRAVVMIVLGIVVLVAAAARDDINSWQGYLLAGICFALAALFLFLALRD